MTLSVSDQFHDQYFLSRAHDKTTFLGVPVVKAVSDLWAYQEVLFDLKPTLIVEMGVWCGGFALYLDWLCERALPDTQILAVDVTDRRIDLQMFERPRIQFKVMSTLDPEFVRMVQQARDDQANPGPMMVSVDDNHHADHVLKELEMLEGITRTGDYVVLEDTNINKRIRPRYGPGPGHALAKYLAAHPGVYEVDTEREAKFGFTYAPGGWLRRL